MSNSDTLRDIAEESALSHAEKVSLNLIAEEFEKLQAEIERHRWIPVSERLPEKGECLVLCEGKIRQVQIRIRTDDEDGKMTSCAIRDLGCVYLGCDECITHWKPIILPDQAKEGGKRQEDANTPQGGEPPILI